MSWTDHPFGYCPVAWYSNNGCRRYLPLFGFVYRKMGQAGKMTSTVLTFYPTPIRGVLRVSYNHTYAVTRDFCRKRCEIRLDEKATNETYPS